jgi:hypothetical protein
MFSTCVMIIHVVASATRKQLPATSRLCASGRHQRPAVAAVLAASKQQAKEEDAGGRGAVSSD